MARTRTRYTRDSVPRSYHQGHSGDPMVNVKVHHAPYTSDGWRRLAEKVAADNGHDAGEAVRFGGYIVKLYDDDAPLLHDVAFSVACEWGWESLTTDAQELFGRSVKVYSAGRSGGWAVVDGLPDVDGWDAVQLGKWRKWEKWARDNADDVPYQMCAFLLLNHWEPKQERAREARERARERVQSRAVGV